MLGISIGSPANELIKPLNARMPAIITEADLKKWIGEEPVSKQDLKRMLQLFAARRCVFGLSASASATGATTAPTLSSQYPNSTAPPQTKAVSFDMQVV